MPEKRSYNGKLVKTAKKIFVHGQPYIKITFESRKYQRGEQIIVSLDEYDQNVERSFTPSKVSVGS